MKAIAISGVGVHLPEHQIVSEELAASYNAYAASHNKESLQAAAVPMRESSADFMIQSFGVKSRRVLDRKNILENMKPLFAPQKNEELSLQCALAVPAAQKAVADAGKSMDEIDAVIFAASHTQRPYPALAIELQNALGIKGFGYDMNAACSSACFAISAASGFIQAGIARAVLVVASELYTCSTNFLDRKSHFIFGDGCAAAVVEEVASCKKKPAYKILGIKLWSQFSNNIRNNFGFMNRCMPEMNPEEQYFQQNGKEVRKDLVPLVSDHILTHLNECGVELARLQRLWLHQANLYMIRDIATNVFQRYPSREELPTPVEEYGNTGASGVLIALDQSRELCAEGVGVLCAFGAGYTIGSLIVENV